MVVPSQKMNSVHTSSARTRPSMAPAKATKAAAKRARRAGEVSEPK